MSVTALGVCSERRVMAGRIHLTLACGRYDLNRALIEGDVRPEGIDFAVVTASSPERHWRMERRLEFDACGFSMASYLMVSDRSSSPFLAIPAFPHRRFRRSYVILSTPPLCQHRRRDPCRRHRDPPLAEGRSPSASASGSRST